MHTTSRNQIPFSQSTTPHENTYKHDNINNPTLKNVLQPTCNNVEQPTCNNVEQQTCNNVEQPTCNNVEQPTCNNVEQPACNNVEQTTCNTEDIKIHNNLEHKTHPIYNNYNTIYNNRNNIYSNCNTIYNNNNKNTIDNKNLKSKINNISRSQWQSLSGYLIYKSSEGFSRLFKRRLWFILDDLKSVLLGYRNAETSKSTSEIRPTVQIDLTNVGIFPNPHNHGELTLICPENEHYLIADNNESMVIWLLALQSVRNRGHKITNLANSMASVSCNFSLQHNKESPILNGMIRQQNMKKGRSFSLYPHSFTKTMTGKTSKKLQAEAFSSAKHYSLESGIESFKSRGIIDQDYNNSQDTVDSAFESDHVNWLPWQSSRRNTSDDVASDEPFFVCRNRLRTTSGSSVEVVAQGDPQNQLVLLEKQMIHSKTMMAKLLNRECVFKEMIEEKDQAIKELRHRLHIIENSSRKTAAEMAMRNKLDAMLQHASMQSDEIKRLTEMRASDGQQITTQQNVIEKLTLSLAAWKDDYVFLLQSSIPLDKLHKQKQQLFGGDVHKQRVKELLHEARMCDPSLPDYDILSLHMNHVDKNGFKHTFENEELLLHYLCLQLHLHYSSMYPEQQNCQEMWRELLSPGSSFLSANVVSGVKHMCRQGIPMQYRGVVWKELTQAKVVHTRAQKGSNYFKHLITRAFDSLLCGYYRKQIFIDLLRTMPNNINYCHPEAEGIRKLKEVLQAFSFHNPCIGYCQGLNFIASMLLLFLDTEDAFWALVAITEEHFDPSYFDKNLTGAKVDQEIFQEMLKQSLPDLYHHIKSFDLEFSTITINWFLSLFIDIVPFQTLLRIWDCFLMEGSKVLFRFSLAILKQNQAVLLAQKDVLGLLKTLKNSTRLLFDVDGLIKVAFEGLKPFQKRKQISHRRVHFEEIFERKMTKFYDFNFENEDEINESGIQAIKRQTKFKKLSCQYTVNSHESVDTRVLKYIDAAPVSYNNTWIVCTSQEVSKMCILNNNQKDIHTEFHMNTQVLCVCEVGDLVLISTLSKQLHAYAGQHPENKIWSCDLKEASYSLCHRLILHPHQSFFSIYAGLDNGLLAFFEKVPLSSTVESPSCVQFGDPMYLPLSHCPITMLLLVEPHVWVANENSIHVIHSESLNLVTSFKISKSFIDFVRCMVLYEPHHYQHFQQVYQQNCNNPQQHVNNQQHSKSVNVKGNKPNEENYNGSVLNNTQKNNFKAVWISLEGSSVIQCWNSTSHTCIFLFDVCRLHPVLNFKEEEFLNTQRVTSMLCAQMLLWVGTGNGNVYIFSIVPPTTLTNPTPNSSPPKNRSLPQSVIYKQICKLKTRANTLPTSTLGYDIENQLRNNVKTNNINFTKPNDTALTSNNDDFTNGHDTCTQHSKIKNFNTNDENNRDRKFIEQNTEGSRHQTESEIGNEKRSRIRNSIFKSLHESFKPIDSLEDEEDDNDLDEFIKELKTIDLVMKNKKAEKACEEEEDDDDDFVLSDQNKSKEGSKKELRRVSKTENDKLNKTKNNSMNNSNNNITHNNKDSKTNNNKWLASSFNTCLFLESKFKISERPVRCIKLIDSHPSNVTILTCAGNYTNSESVLLWKKDENKNIWMKESVKNSNNKKNPPSPIILGQHREEDVDEDREDVSPFVLINRKFSNFFGKN